MKKTIFQILAIAIIAFAIASCGQSIEKKLTGTWKVADVRTDFDESQVTPQMLQQVVELQKQTYFRILNDSTMVIISNKNTYEANWTIDEENNTITYFFEGNNTRGNELGKFEEGQIVSKSKTALGSMTIYYKKEK